MKLRRFWAAGGERAGMPLDPPLDTEFCFEPLVFALRLVFRRYSTVLPSGLSGKRCHDGVLLSTRELIREPAYNRVFI